MFRRLTLALLMCLTLTGLGLAAQDAEKSPAPVDINSAPVEQIVEVVHDEELAEKIIEGRPYANKRQILTRDLVSEEEYERIREMIVARRVQTAP